jgi:hypothetical protein
VERGGEETVRKTAKGFEQGHATKGIEIEIEME